MSDRISVLMVVSHCAHHSSLFWRISKTYRRLKADSLPQKCRKLSVSPISGRGSGRSWVAALLPVKDYSKAWTGWSASSSLDSRHPGVLGTSWDTHSRPSDNAPW